MLRIDVRTAKPPYEQIRDGIILSIRSGELRPGEKLPTVRALAADLEVAPNTVAKAYLELERSGVIITRGRRGSFVAAADPRLPVEAQLAARSFVDEMNRLGVGRSAALDLVVENWSKLPTPPTS